jgi:hypothetical protein
VEFDATIEEAESLLKTEYNVYTHVKTGDDFLAVEEYSIPPISKNTLISPPQPFISISQSR